MMHFCLAAYILVMCTVVHHGKHAPNGLPSVFTFFPQISAACLCSCRKSPFGGSSVNLYLVPEIHLFLPTAKISTSVNSFQVSTLGNEAIPWNLLFLRDKQSLKDTTKLTLSDYYVQVETLLHL